MSQDSMKAFVAKQFESAGIMLNGKNPWDIQILDDRFYQKVVREGSLGFGEAYMENLWEAKQLDELIYRLLRSQLSHKWEPTFNAVWHWLQAFALNMQSKSRAFEVGERHYDIGNELFVKMLDKRMTYSCGYWKDAKNLDEAQEAKIDLVCRKVGLEPGMKVLDIGCGWASFAKYAAEKYKAKVVGITVSKNQLELAREICKGLPIELRLQDYREINEPFDRVVSIGQMEHVGYKNYKQYFAIVNRCLDSEGLFLLHTIGSNHTTRKGSPWLQKYIFPNGMLPSVKQLASASESLFTMEDWHNFGVFYDNTLMAWYANFHSHWDEIKQNYDDRFYRMWKYYLLSCAGAFRARYVQLWQIVYSKNGVIGGYQSVR